MGMYHEGAMENTQSTLDVALHVAKYWPGCRILPIERGKLPALREVPHWQRDASNDPEVITAWFSGTDYGVGVTGLLAIDGDNEDLCRQQFYERDLNLGIQLSGNPERKTWLFRQPAEPFGDGRTSWGEVKGSGYVVLPPSRHTVTDGKCYPCANGFRHSYVWLTGHAMLPELPGSVEQQLVVLGVRRQNDSAIPNLTDTETKAKLEAWRTSGDPCAAVLAVVEPVEVALADRDTSKHPLVMESMLRLLRLGEQGHHGVKVGHERLWTAFQAAAAGGPVRRNIRDEWRRGAHGAVALIERDGLTLEWDKGCCPGHAEAEIDRAAYDTVFGATPKLAGIRQAAEAAMCSPWAVLAAALNLVVSHTPPEYVTPALVGGDHGSINLYTLLVDESGTGKSAAWRVAKAHVRLEYDPLAEQPRVIGGGTGQGVLQAFLQPDPDYKSTGRRWMLRDTPQVLVWVDEAEQIAAISQGVSMWPSVIRSAWSGSMISTANADPNLNRHLPEMSYRLALMVAGTPDRCGFLVEREAELTGLAWRWVVLPTDNPEHPAERPSAPEPMTWHLPGGGQRVTVQGLHGEAVERIVMAIPPSVELAVINDRIESLRRGTPLHQPHELYSMIKLGCAIALLHGETEITDELWAVTEALWAKSKATRAEVQTKLMREAELAAKGSGRKAALAGEGQAEYLEAQSRRDAAAVWRLLDRHADPKEDNDKINRKHDPDDGCTARCVAFALRGRAGMTATRRHRAVATAVELGWVEVAEGSDGRTRYRRDLEAEAEVTE